MRQGKKRRFTGSFAAKAAAFILLAAGMAAGLCCILMCVFMAKHSFYTSSRQHAMGQALSGWAMQTADRLRAYVQDGELEEAEAYFKRTNMEAEFRLYSETGDGELLWRSCDRALDTAGYAQKVICLKLSELKTPELFGTHSLNTRDLYACYIYFDLSFELEDNLKAWGNLLLFLYEAKEAFILAAAGCMLLSLICFLFLICSAGHKNGVEGIVPGVLERIPFDILTIIFVGGALVCGLRITDNPQDFVLIAGGTLFTLWLTLYCMDFAVRVKQGAVWRQMFVFMVLKQVWRVIRWVLISLPTVFVTAGFFAVICVLELLGGCWLIRYSRWLLPWTLEKIVLFLLVLYIAVICRELLKASRALAEGQENYRVDTSKMFGDFKEHGENLNSLGLGISRAVAERMKSERLKTELITNVSHDIKTPLTSIINYADLICEEVSNEEVSDEEVSNEEVSNKQGLNEEGSKLGNKLPNAELMPTEAGGEMYNNEKIKEYAEVLLRQSRRLKKLLDDLMEASKATTGNMEVKLEPCEVGVLLTQAVGEYQRRMEEKALELIVRQPEEPIRIMVDGRHLWRVFDNLLNNICKYSQEHSRVYLSVETREGRVCIIFRNMSKYALDIPPKELEERFVRGDKSRHMEGNGLGLSIAKSLTELQNGTMEITTDGDLFKVVVSFEIM